MSQRPDKASVARSRARGSVYTVLLVVAALALLVGVGVVWWKNVQLTGDDQPAGQMIQNPFHVVEDVG